MDDKLTGNKTTETNVNELVDLHNQLAHMHKYKKNDKIKLNSYLAPLSFLYGIGIWLRIRLFDWGILHSEQYSIPVICIGNLSVGGTGKTPHTEYIIRLLKDKYRIAVLSRGYKRKTSGFILADSESSSLEI